MPSDFPLRHSPFSKLKSAQNPSYSSSSSAPSATVDEGVSSKQRTQSSLPTGSSSTKDQSEEFEEIQAETPPRKAIFTFGNDSLENVESIQSSTASIFNKTKADLRSKISWDPSGSPLQNMFIPPEEQKRAEGASLAHKAANPNPPLERKNRNFSRGSFISQNGLEEANQLTAQTALTDFITPLRSVIKPIWARREEEKTPPPTTSRFVKFVRFLKKGRSELPLSSFKRIVKSSFAFFVASLMVIIAPIQEKVGPYAYMAPFITILFDSTRTSGAQLEITFLTCGFLVFGLLYYWLAFGLFAVYNRSFPNATKEKGVISDGAFIIALFFFLAMFILGWLRARFSKLSSPAILLSFFLAISMTRVPIEGTEVPYHQFGISLAPALIGLLISLLVNLILWPESASQDLGKSLEFTLQHSHRSLQLLTSCFLLGPDSQFVRVEDLEDLHRRSMDAATALVKAGREARYEYTYSVHPPTDYKDMIDTILSLQQQMGGFNLAVQREHQLLNLSKSKGDKGISPLSSRSGSFTELKALSLPPSPSAMSLNKLAEEMMPVTPDIDPLLARSLIHDIIHFVKDPLVSLTDISLVAIQAALKLLAEENDLDSSQPTEPITPTDPIDKPCCGCAAPVETGCSHTLPENPEDPWATMDLSTIAPQLRAAITEFEVAEGRCLHLIHQQILFTPHLHNPFPEPMLVVFSGIFSVREFAKELLKLLEEIERFQGLRPSKGLAKKTKSKRLWRPRVGLSKWLRGHRTSEEPHQAEFYASEDIPPPSSTDHAKGEANELKEEFGMDNSPEDPIILPNQRWTKPEYARSSGLSSNQPKSVWSRMRRRLWRLTRHLSSYEVRFGLKLTLAMVILTFPAYVPAFSEMYAEINGPWGAIAAMFIINQTIGGTLYLGVVRLAGTIIGATWGYLTCLANNDVGNIYLVIVMIWVFNAPAWYAIITTSYSRIGFNGLTTFCAVFFVNYSTRDSAVILRLAFIRTLSVVVGLVVSMVIASTLWPYVARNEVRKVVAGLMADMGANFGKVAALCMTQHGSAERANLDEQVRCQQHQLQKRLLAANTLLLFANREPRLKGPFASETYQEQLRVLQDTLDQLVAMRAAVLQIGPEVQSTVIIPFNAYHKFMVSSVILYFYVLSGALRAKHPLPPYPPPIHAIRHKLMIKTRAAMVRKYQKSHARSGVRRNFSTIFNSPSSPHMSVIKQDFNHIYWYSYMAGLLRLFEDVELLGHNVAELVGESTFLSAEASQES